jgi:uncharacterized membrane protein
MLVHFPVAALIGLVATDIAFIYTKDVFWARVGLWLAGVGAAGGWIAGLAGMVDVLMVRKIRRLITSWIHGIFAIMLLSLASLNWLLRVNDPALAVVPYGIYLSFLCGALIAVTAAMGGQLVYEHAVGVHGDTPVHSKSD